MGKLILEMQVSLDGFMAGPEGQTDWMIWNWGPVWGWDKALQHFHIQLTLSAHHLVISRQMAEEGFIAHCQQVVARKDEQATFAQHLSETRKTVISTVLTKVTISQVAGKPPKLPVTRLLRLWNSSKKLRETFWCMAERHSFPPY